MVTTLHKIAIVAALVANLVDYVIGPSGINWFISRFLQREGLPILGGMFMTFYVGTKLMFHVDDAKKRHWLGSMKPIKI